MESEFIALELVGQEAEWLKGLLADVPLWGKQATPISLHCDSQVAIRVGHNSAYDGKRRHIRYQAQCGEIAAETWSHIPTVCEIREEFRRSSHKGIDKAIGATNVGWDAP